MSSTDEEPMRNTNSWRWVSNKWNCWWFKLKMIKRSIERPDQPCLLHENDHCDEPVQLKCLKQSSEWRNEEQQLKNWNFDWRIKCKSSIFQEMRKQTQAKEQAAVNEQKEDKDDQTFLWSHWKQRRNEWQMMDMMKSWNKICDLPKSGWKMWPTNAVKILMLMRTKNTES